MLYVVAVAALAVLYCVLTDNLIYILVGVGILIALVVAVLLIWSSVCLVLMLMSKWKNAEFVKTDLPTEKSRFNVAYYMIDGKEVRNIFPDEGILKDKLYKTDKTYHVLYNKKLDKAFDRFSITTCLLGFICGALGGVMILLVLL
ncbi:MAG: hypothetical protein K5639_00010 [Eubacterium sp.]|nr:hypothetical protein [Eubacterium sp.]